MAGLGKKTFAVNEILTAADVNGYLMEQSVMVFDDDTARTNGLASPSEGMITYLKSDDGLYKYDGSSWISIQADTATFMPKSGGTFTGEVTFSSAITTSAGIIEPSVSSYGTFTETDNMIRNITASTADPTGGTDGDVWLKYEV